MKKLTVKTANKLESGLSLVKFYADWCGPCRLMTPVIESLEDDFETVSFYEVDVDKDRALSDMFEVKALPTIHLVKDGKSVHSWVGMVIKGTIKSALTEFIK